MIISRSILLEWETFQTNVVEKIGTHVLYSMIFFKKSCRFWDNVEKYCRAGETTVIVWRMRSACWITRATNTHSEYVILLPLHGKSLYERPSKLRYLYTACVVLTVSITCVWTHFLKLVVIKARYQASAAVWLRLSLFWVFARNRNGSWLQPYRDSISVQFSLLL